MAARLLGICPLVVLGALLTQTAEAETWCIRDAGSPGPGACVFPSAHECGMAARLNPFGGICERQPLGLTDRSEKKSTSRRSGSRPRTSRR
jgi:hypothetical protein